MEDIQFNKKHLIRYLIWTFAIAWALQIGTFFLYSNGDRVIYQFLIIGVMFVPSIGVFLSGAGFKSINFKVRIRGNIKYYLISWFSPVVLTVLGMVLYFALFPSQLDLEGTMLSQMLGEEGLKQIEAQGLSVQLLMIISLIQCVTYAPAINMFFAAGEEIGWRGFLYPQLKARFGRVRALIIGGVIWGVWHWPLIWLIGYNYGAEYFGYPVAGMLLFCVITTALGIICEWLYEKGGSIWTTSIFHGSLNAAATIPQVVTTPDSGSMTLLGSAPNGIIAGLPIIIFAAIILFAPGKAEKIPE